MQLPRVPAFVRRRERRVSRSLRRAASGFTRIAGVNPAETRERVQAARTKQLGRGSINASMPPGRLREIFPLDAASGKTLEMAVRRLALSAPAHDRILMELRTSADLGGSEELQAKHIAEAVQYRSLNREYWK